MSQIFCEMGTLACITTLCIFIFMSHLYIALTEGRHFTTYNGSSDIFTKALLIRRTSLCSQAYMNNLQKQFAHMFYCVSSYIRHCRFTIDSSTSKKHNMSISFCSKIYLMFIPPGTTLYSIYSIPEHFISIDFLVFIFFRTFDVCGPDKVNVLDISIKENHIYCGRRTPWSILSGGRRIHLVVDKSSIKLCRLSLFYTAKHLNQIKGVTEERVWGLPNSVLPIAFPGQILANTFSLCVSPQLKLVAEINWLKQTNSLMVAVYDGPGIYSPCVFVADSLKLTGNYRAPTSAFCIYVVIKNTAIAYDETSLMIKSVSANSKVCKVHTNKRQMMGFVRETSTNSKGNFVCTKTIFGEHNLYFMVPMLHVVRLIFDGPDTLIDSLNEGCHYGGIFLNVIEGNSTFKARAILAGNSHYTVIKLRCSW